jgi:signal transduction histidine kinase
MIRSNFAITRLILLPYGMLLMLYLLVVGGGGAWLHHRVHTVETQMLVDEVMTAIEPLAEKLRPVDAVDFARRREPWLISDIQALFARIPTLRTVSVRGLDAGFQIDGEGNGTVSSRATSPLPVDTRRENHFSSAAQRLHTESDALFLIRFDLTNEPASLVRLDFGFDRELMLARINEGVANIRQAILGFIIVGALSILLALGITVVAMRITRNLEAYFQEIYQHASKAELAASLVHDLRNPLMSLRTNVKALLVSPSQTHEITEEMDRDIIALNNKLTAFLKLTRHHEEERFELTDLRELIHDAVRLAEPALTQHGLGVEVDVPPDLPKVSLQKTAMRDALFNVIMNAIQSGQREGTIRIAAWVQDDTLSIVLEDQGHGIAEQDLPQIFNPFFTTREEGNGLGLAIVRRITLTHQGMVHAENRPQGGTRIVFTLPLQQQKKAPHWWNKLNKHSQT